MILRPGGRKPRSKAIRRDRDDELGQEIRQHLEMLADEHNAKRGMSPREARRRAALVRKRRRP